MKKKESVPARNARQVSPTGRGENARKSQPVVTAKSLGIGYGKIQVAGGISFSLEEGSILAVVGPNGSGKSTLLKTVAGFLSPLVGELYLEGSPAERMRRETKAKFLSVVTTDRPDVEWMKVWDVASSGRYPYTGKLGILSQEDQQIVTDALVRLEAEHLKDRYFRELSDGQKQRVMLAKSIAQRPRLLILDEPTSYLDIRYQLEFMQIAADLARRDGMALLLSVHELSVARTLADYVLTLKDGRMDRLGESSILTRSYIRELYSIPEHLTLGGIDGI